MMMTGMDMNEEWIIILLVSVFNVVSASAPDPLLIETLGSQSPGASAGGELPFPAGPRDGMDHSGGGDGMGESRFTTPYTKHDQVVAL